MTTQDQHTEFDPIDEDPIPMDRASSDDRLAGSAQPGGHDRADVPGRDPVFDAPAGQPDQGNRDAITEPGETRTAAGHSGAAGVKGSLGERLIPEGRADEYSARWDGVKGEFVDEPEKAVASADQLVNELLRELQELFGNQRHDLEQRMGTGESSTEDLRLALRRYRSFFDRLLSV